MSFISVLLLSIAATSDSLVIGFNFGLKNVRIGFFSNLYISAVCFAGTYAAMLAGRLLGAIVSARAATVLGGLVLLLLGLWMLKIALQSGKSTLSCTNPETADRNRSNTIELRESLGIGLVLALNNLGLGIGAGMAGLPSLATSLLCAGASFIFVQCGYALGKKITAKRLAGALEIISSLLIIALGVRSFF